MVDRALHSRPGVSPSHRLRQNERGSEKNKPLLQSLKISAIPSMSASWFSPSELSPVARCFTPSQEVQQQRCNGVDPPAVSGVPDSTLVTPDRKLIAIESIRPIQSTEPTGLLMQHIISSFQQSYARCSRHTIQLYCSFNDAYAAEAWTEYLNSTPGIWRARFIESCGTGQASDTIIPAIRRSLNSADIASTLFVIQLRNYADDSCRQSEEWVSRKLDAFAFVEDDIPAAIPIQQRLFALLSPTRSTNPEVLAETVRLELLCITPSPYDASDSGVAVTIDWPAGHASQAASGCPSEGPMCRANNAAEISAQEYVLGSHLALPKPEQPYPEPQSRAENERHFNDGWSSETCHSIGFQREDPYIRWHERATNTAGESGVCLQGSTAPGSLKRNGAISPFNLVDLEKIRRGVDVRTTVMLRNIPNRVDQRMLKQFLDGTSFGKYDFLYLRIDFTNNSNVGYGFVNFADPASIIEFVERRVGNSWGLFGSTKRVEVSYAAVQGQDCLIQKFRNSSVMLEHPSFRPLIFYPKSSHLQGQPQPFPEPDNDSKMRRSVANAGQIGLFSPRHQKDGLRDQVRSRRSQFDRGTRMASLEEGKLSSPGGLSSDLSFLSPVSSHRSSLTSNNSPVTPSRPRSTNPYEYFDSSYSQFLPARASLLLNPVLRTASTSAGIPAYRENLAAKFGASSSEHIISDGISIGPSLYSSRTGNNAFDPFVIHQSDNTRY